jgi:hypothetical protein
MQRTGSSIAPLFSDIGNLNRFPGRCGAGENGARHGTRERLATQKVGIGWRSTMRCANSEKVTFPQPEIGKFCSADMHRILENDTEHGRKFTPRGTDDLEHFRGRGLLLLQLTQLAIALVKLFVEGRLAGAVGKHPLCTTLDHRGLFQPRSAAFALYAAKSFQCRPRQKTV